MYYPKGFLNWVKRNVSLPTIQGKQMLHISGYSSPMFYNQEIRSTFTGLGVTKTSAKLPDGCQEPDKGHSLDTVMT